MAKEKTTTKVKSKAKSTIKKIQSTASKKSKYFEGIGRRKTSTSRVRIEFGGKGEFIVNGIEYKKYLPTEELVGVANAPLRKIKMLDQFNVTVKVQGGGSRGQAEAIRHGLARALVEFDPEMRLRIKKSGFLKRDPRAKERKKYGLKKARRAPQWSKR